MVTVVEQVMAPLLMGGGDAGLDFFKKKSVVESNRSKQQQVQLCKKLFTVV